MDVMDTVLALLAMLVPLLAGEGTRKIMSLLKGAAAWLDRQNALIQQTVVLVIAFVLNLGLAALSAATGVTLPEIGADPMAVDEATVGLYVSTFFTFLISQVRHFSLKKLSSKAVGLKKDPPTSDRDPIVADLSGAMKRGANIHNEFKNLP